MNSPFTYAAFICHSRSHRDECFARRLEEALERYRLSHGLAPLFRMSLPAAGGGSIPLRQQALARSRFLVVICSENALDPNTADGSRMEEELRFFLAQRGQEEGLRHIIPLILRRNEATPSEACLLPLLRCHALPGVDVLTMGQEGAISNVAARLLKLRPDELWSCTLPHTALRPRTRCLLGTAAALLSLATLWGLWLYHTPQLSYYADYIERDNIPVGLHELTEQQVQQRHRHYRFTRHKFRLRSIEYCNAAGQTANHAAPWHEDRAARLELEYDADGKLVRSVLRGARGEAQVLREYSPGGIAHRQLGRGVARHEGIEPLSPVLNILRPDAMRWLPFKSRYARVAYRQGLLVHELFCTRGNDTPARNSMGIEGLAYEYDSKGRRVAVRYLKCRRPSEPDAGMEGTASDAGIGGYGLRYDGQGRVCAMVPLDSRGQPDCRNLPEARVRYDEQGNAVELAWFGADGKPRAFRHSIAALRIRYDGRGNQTELQLLGEDGKPTLSEDGFSRVSWKHDDNGHTVEENFFDAEGRPCLHDFGYARRTQRLDAQGWLVEQRHDGLDGLPCADICGEQHCRWRMDAAGRIIEESHYGADGHLMADDEGYARLPWTYDAAGRCIEHATFGEDDLPRASREGIARTTWSYDEDGLSCEEAFFGADGRPHTNSLGAARVRTVMDERENMLEIAWFDEDGKACTNKNGVARITWQYDEADNILAEAYYGAEGHALVTQDFGAAGMERITRRYDADGRLLETAWFGTDGLPKVNMKGHARVTRRYNEAGELVEEACFGEDGREGANGAGLARVVYEYDARGRCSAVIIYDARGAVFFERRLGGQAPTSE